MSERFSVDRLVAEVARRHAAGVLDEAVAQARSQVRDELAHRIQDAMLAHLASATDTVDTPPAEAGTEVARPGAEAGTGPGTEVARETGQEWGLYVYGFTRGERLDLGSVPGVGADGPARVIARDGLGLVVSDIRLAELAGLDTGEPADSSRLAEYARRHDAVVRAVFEQDAVLPLRFGTVLTDTAAAEQLLEQQRRDAMATLERVAGKQEWGTKVLFDPRRTAKAGPSGGQAPASGTEYLTRKRDELAAREAELTRRRELLDRAHAALAEHAADSVYRSSVGDHVLLDTAYLVPESDTDDFLARVDTVGQELAEHDMSLRATGPWPPYSFAVIEG